MSAEMIGRPHWCQSIEDETTDMVAAAGLLYLAVEGHNQLTEGAESSEWDRTAMTYGARLVHELAERLAARLEERRTRFCVPITGMMQPAGPDEAERAA